MDPDPAGPGAVHRACLLARDSNAPSLPSSTALGHPPCKQGRPPPWVREKPQPRDPRVLVPVPFATSCPELCSGPQEDAVKTTPTSPPCSATWPPSHRTQDPQPGSYSWAGPKGPCRHDVSSPHVLALHRPAPVKPRGQAAVRGPSWTPKQVASMGVGTPRASLQP